MDELYALQFYAISNMAEVIYRKFNESISHFFAIFKNNTVLEKKNQNTYTITKLKSTTSAIAYDFAITNIDRCISLRGSKN